LRYGDLIPSFSTKDIDSNLIGTDTHLGKWGLIFYFDSIADLNFLPYSRVLARKYASSGLQIIAITDQVSDELVAFIRDEPVSYPIIADTGGSLKNILRLTNHRNGLIFVDPNGVIQFSLSHLLPSDQLRQLVERFVAGTVNYDLRQQIALQPLSKLPPYRIKNIETGEEMTLNKLNLRNAVIIFFTSNCPTCSWDTYMNALQELELSTSPHKQNQYVFFGRNFAVPNLLTDLRTRNISSTTYITQEDFAELESSYITRSSPGKEVIVIITDSDGSVSAIKPLTTWMKERN
jgi:peroxiredoxin